MQRAITLVLVSLAFSSVRTSPCAAEESPSLLQMIAEWQYPGSEIHGAEMADGATIDDRGERTVPSITCKTVMTTDATVEKVMDYYRKKLSPKPNAGGSKSKIVDKVGRSVVFSDDSEGRPFAIHSVIIHEGDTSTFLVISRGKDETRTHIAWKHYRRFRQK